LVSVAANRLANLYRDAGRDADAEFYYLKALPPAQAWGARRAIQVLNNLLSLYLETGQYSKAENLPMTETLKLAPQGLDATRTKTNLASLAMLRGRNAEAAVLLGSAAQEFEVLGDIQDHAIALNNLGAVLLSQNRLDEAVLQLEHVVKLVDEQSGVDFAVKMKARINLGAIYLRAGRRLEAESIFREAATHVHEYPGQEELSRSTYLSLLAEGLRLTGDKRGAKRLLKMAQATNPSNGAPPRGGLVVDIADLLSKRAPK
jgi:tetratricopeptide (TPR) repeat protein